MGVFYVFLIYLFSLRAPLPWSNTTCFLRVGVCMCGFLYVWLSVCVGFSV